MTEAQLLPRLLMAASQLGARLWRNQSGAHRNSRGQWIQYGLAHPGGSDFIGYVPVTITPEMVGYTVAIFVAIEAKTDHGRVSDAQTHFLEVVTSHGARAGVARSVDDIRAIVEGV